MLYVICICGDDDIFVVPNRAYLGNSGRNTKRDNRFKCIIRNSHEIKICLASANSW